MKTNRVRGIVVACAAAILTLAVAGSAIAAVPSITSRQIVAADNSLSIDVTSVGDAGNSHGNVNPWTSPVDTGDFYWFNKMVSITAFTFPDIGNEPTVFSGATYARNFGTGYGPQQEFDVPFDAVDDGVYSIVATGTDTVGDVSGEITPAFGIDTIDPVVTSDTLPFYAGTPVVTITATDTMSGVENMSYNYGTSMNYIVEPDFADPANFSMSFPFSGEGPQSVKWVVFDNAGNAKRGSEDFIIDNTAPMTTSDAVGTYNGAATIHLSATDPGGALASGVDATFYSLDGGLPVEGTTVMVPAPVDGSAAHALQFWTVDLVGNEESHNTVLFTVNSQHTITVTPPSHGTITPSGSATINLNANSAVYQIKPSTGYHITDVKIDGVSVGKPTTYQFLDVVANHTIAASFAINTYSLTPSKSNSHGSISPSSKQTVNYGASKKFTMKANTNYKISKVLVDGVSKGHPTSYTFSNVKGNHTIKVYFVHK